MLTVDTFDWLARNLARRFQVIESYSWKAIQADFRASGDRLLDQDQRQKRLNPMRTCVNFIFLQSPNKDELTKDLHLYQQTGTEVDERTARKERKVERNNETNDDMHKWFAGGKQEGQEVSHGSSV